MKTATLTILFAVLPAISGAPLSAQKMLLPDQSGRVLQLIDLKPLLAQHGDDTEAPAAPPAAVAVGAPGIAIAAAPVGAPVRAVDYKAVERAGIASFVRTFVQPPLGAGDDVQVLGDRWLAVLASQPQIASAERLIAAAGRAPEDVLTTEIRIYEMTPADYDKLLRPLLPAKTDKAEGVQQAIISNQAAGDLQRALVNANINTMEAPSFTSFPLQPVHLFTGEEIAYIKDFNIEVHEKSFVADPVVASIRAGISLDVVAGYTSKELVGLQCTMEKQDVVKPIAEFKTTLPGSSAPVTIQLPRLTGVRLQQTAELPVGSSVLLAARKTDGGWLAATIGVIRARGR